jgi:MoxR-like ATPase
MDETRDKILKEAGEDIERIRGEMAKRVIGQRNLIDGLLCGLIAEGHILLEGSLVWLKP